jgi:hypothetical protein
VPTGRVPAHANLEHLRNEAKKLLKDMRRRSPDTKMPCGPTAHVANINPAGAAKNLDRVTELLR